MENKKLKNYIVSVLRSASIRYPSRSEAMKRARVERGLYRCNMCEGLFKRQQIILDHINPCVPITGWYNLEGFCERLFCEPEGFQVLCCTCSDAKTMQEDEMRKYYTKERNEKKKQEEKEAKRLAKQKKKEEKSNGTT